MKNSLFFICLCLAVALQAQNIGYRKNYTRTWQTETAAYESSPPIPPQFTHAHAVEQRRVTNFAFNNRYQTTIITGYVRTKILTQTGAQMCNVFSLPESLDPLAEKSDLSALKVAQVYRPKLFDLEPLFFHARIIKPTGEVVAVKPTDSIQVETLRFDGLERAAFSYHFALGNQLQPNDVLEIEYACFVPFMLDYRRIFMHGSRLPAMERVVELTVPLNEQLYVYQLNGLPPPDTLAKPADRRYQTLRWQMQNLPPALQETHAHAADDLPHLFFYFHNKAFGDYENDQIVRFQPYTWNYYAYDWVAFRHINIQKTQRLLSPKETALNLFYDNHTAAITQSPAPEKLTRLVDILNNRFDFRTENDAFSTTDERMAKLGAFYRERILKDMNHRLFYQSMFDRVAAIPYTDVVTEGHIGFTDAKLEKISRSLARQFLTTANRYEVYEGLLTRLQQDYYKVIVPDTRISRIYPDTCLPVLGAEILYAMEHNNNLYYLFPKNRRFGYGVNELPFYLQGAPAVHIWQMADNRLSPQTTFVAPTPTTNAAYNQRITQVNASVNLGERATDFYAIVSLSGQYSTLLRGFYLYQVIDSTINPLYYRLPTALTPATILHGQKIEQTRSDFPYTTQIHLQYSDNTLLAQLTDTTYRLNLARFIQHVYANDFVAEGRTQPFYPDFAGTDVFQYTLQFDRPIHLPQQETGLVNLQNELGEYQFTLTQTAPNSLLLTSIFTTSATCILPDKAAHVAAIYQQLKNAEQVTITITAPQANK